MAADPRLVERALTQVREGDPQAYEVVWRHMTPGLVRYLAITSPAGREVRAAEVVAQTWAAANRRLRHFRGGRSALVAMLVQLTAQVQVDAGRRPSSAPDQPVIDLRAPAGGRPEPTTGMSTAEAIRRVRALGPQVAEMIALRVVLGLSAAETAEVVGARAGAVRVAVYQGLRQAGGAAALDPWRLDRWLDTCPKEAAGAAVTAQLAGVDEQTADLVQALRAPATERELAGLAAGVQAFERARAVGAVAVLALLARKLTSLRPLLGGKAAAFTVGAAMLSAPALVGLTGAQAAPAPTPAVAMAQSTTPYALLSTPKSLSHRAIPAKVDRPTAPAAPTGVTPPRSPKPAAAPAKAKAKMTAKTNAQAKTTAKAKAPAHRHTTPVSHGQATHRAPRVKHPAYRHRVVLAGHRHRVAGSHHRLHHRPQHGQRYWHHRVHHWGHGHHRHWR